MVDFCPSAPWQSLHIFVYSCSPFARSPISAGADELLLLAVLLATDEGALELGVDEGSGAALELGSAELKALETDASAEETLDDEALDKEDGCELSADELLEAWLLSSAELVLCAEVEAGE